MAGGADGADSFHPLGAEGPMARNVGDCALFLDVMAGFDPIWPTAFPAPEQSYLAQCLADPGALRIGFSPDLGRFPVEPDMAAALFDALHRLDAPDLRIDEETPRLDGLEQAFRTLRGLSMWTAQKATPEAISRAYKPTLAENIRQGGLLTVEDISEALLTRSRLYHEMRGYLARYDVLACPVTGIGALNAEIEYPPEIAGVVSKDYLDWLGFSFVASLCGLPAMSLPVGHMPDGRPVGLQLIGPPRSDGRLLQIARRLEDALDVPSVPIDPVRRH